MSASNLGYGKLLTYGQKFGRWTLGMGTPGQQMLGSTIVGVVVLVSSSVSFGVTLILLPIVVFWFLVGALRLIPFVNSLWPL